MKRFFLKGKHIHIFCTETADFSVLQGIKFKNLSLDFTINPEFSDLSVLKNLDNFSLNISDTKVNDLSPLRGKTIDYIDYFGNTKFEDMTEKELKDKFDIKVSP